MTRPNPSMRGDYARIDSFALRWDDTDVYGHVNNAVHYRLMDTAVNGYLVQKGVWIPLNRTQSFWWLHRSAIISQNCGFRVPPVWA